MQLAPNSVWIVDKHIFFFSPGNKHSKVGLHIPGRKSSRIHLWVVLFLQSSIRVLLSMNFVHFLFINFWRNMIVGSFVRNGPTEKIFCISTVNQFLFFSWYVRFIIFHQSFPPFSIGVGVLLIKSSAKKPAPIYFNIWSVCFEFCSHIPFFGFM